MAGLILDNIKKSFGDTQVLKGVSLHVADGEFVSLVGPSGCGKSTLLRIIAGLEEQSSGDILLGDRSVAGVRAADRNLSMVFQSYALYPHLSVAENISVPLRMRRMSALQRLPAVGRFLGRAPDLYRDMEQDVLEAAQKLEIDHVLDRKPGQLSGGQRQRVALARAMVRDPAAFLLDEPLSNLDAKLRVQTRVEIAQLHRQLGTTFVYVTHDQVEAMTMSNRIAVMMNGRILQCAPPNVVYEDPSDIHVAEFIGSPKINILPVKVDTAGRLTLLGQTLPVITQLPLGPARIGLRAEALRLAGAEALLTGVVVHSENLGPEVFAQVDVPGLSERLVLRAGTADRGQLKTGATIGIGVDWQHVLVFDDDGQRVRELDRAPMPANAVA